MSVNLSKEIVFVGKISSLLPKLQEMSVYCVRVSRGNINYCTLFYCTGKEKSQDHGIKNTYSKHYTYTWLVDVNSFQLFVSFSWEIILHIFSFCVGGR